MRSFVSILFSLLIFPAVSAQVGTPLLTHFGESREIENQCWAITQDVNHVMLFANRKGVFSFDGQDRMPLRIQIIPYTLEMNTGDGKIYMGSENNYGYLEKNLKGQYHYESLSGDSADLGMITKILFNDSLAYFYSDKSVSCLNLKNNSLRYRIYAKVSDPFTGLLINSGNTFINVRNKGLFRVDQDTLFPIVTGYLTRNIEILFSLPYNRKLTLTGFSNGKLSLFDGIKYYNYPIQDDGYIAENLLSKGIIIGDSLYAFATLGGGAVVVEKQTGKVRHIINNQDGLPDDEVFAIGHDSGGGLWLSHQYGLTRADLNLPVRNFSIYPGLKGNLTASLKYDNELFVATSEGLFYLDNEKKYSEVRVLKRNETVQESKIAEPEKPKEISAALVSAPKIQSSKRSLLGRIFGKKSEPAKKEVAPSAPERLTDIPLVITEMPVAEFTVQKVKKLKSIDYVYKKVTGLNEKCRQLIPTEHGILAATNKGLFLVNNHHADVIAGNRYVNSITPVTKDQYLIAAADGYFIVRCINGRWSVSVPDKDFSSAAYSVIRTRDSTLWIGSDNVAYMAGKTPGKPTYKKYTLNNGFPEKYLMSYMLDTVFIFTETGVCFFNVSSGKFEQYNLLDQHAESENFRYPVSNIPLIGEEKGWICHEGESTVRRKELCLLRLFDDIISVNFDDDNIWIVTADNQLYGINRKNIKGITSGADLFIKNIRNEKGVSFELSNIVFERGDNVINFDIVAPAYLNKNLTEYQYFISKVMTEWSPWSDQTSYSMGIQKPGDYTLLVRARDLWGEVGPQVSLLFTIKAPFTRTTFFYILAGLAAILAIFIFVRFRERQLHEKNRILEEKVRERTAEIEAQKEEITSSIEYASRIQMAMLPFSNLFTESFSDYFIIFKPRDIVSGDFYWIGEDDKNIFFTVADCTGHGVPGAFMSTLGISILNEIITHHQGLKANMILNHLREKIKTSLHQTGKEGEAADGMDISLCVLNKNRTSIQFSGAYNSLFAGINGALTEFKADRMPIGIHYGDEASFTNYEIQVSKGDVVYLLSDGFPDQFGGPEGSKFKKAHLRSLLSEILNKPMSEQKRILENEFTFWKGRNEQVDDVTIIGLKI